MKKLIKKIALISSAIFLLSSCDEQVDLNNPTAFTLEALLGTEDGFLLLSNGVMDAYQKVVSNEYLINELRSDNAISNTLIGSISEINSYTLTATEGNSANYYSNNYQTIAKANQIIENRFLAPEEYQYTVGEAFFMRALCHFNVVRAYLNVPYIDKTLDVATQEILQFPQLDPAVVYEKIIEDFKTSIAFLELSPSSSAYKPNKNAAIALLAKVYLSQPNPNYAEAQSLLASIIGQNSLVYTNPSSPIVYEEGVSTDVNHVGELTADFASVFGNFPSEGYNIDTLTYDGVWDNGEETNSEVMFSIAFIADNAEDGDVTSADPDLDDQVETESEIFSFDQSGGGQSNGVNIASLDFLRVMNKTTQPVRLEGTLVPAGINTVLLIEDLDTEIFNNKYPVKTVGEGRGNGNDWIIMRYADVLLLFAESILAGADQTGNAQAIDAFNEVRERAGLEPIQVGGFLTKEALLAERRVEFAYENQRLFDLIRFGVQDDVLNAFSLENSLNYSPSKAYLPFPQREIDATNGFYNQNSGY